MRNIQNFGTLDSDCNWNCEQNFISGHFCRNFIQIHTQLSDFLNQKHKTKKRQTGRNEQTLLIRILRFYHHRNTIYLTELAMKNGS